MKLYRGYNQGGNAASAHLVMVSKDGGTERMLEHHVRHSPTGLSWGYLGSGPADLARSILWDHLGAEPHPACYQAFKFAYVGRWPQEGNWRMTSQQIDEWLEEWSAIEVAGGGQGFATAMGHEAWLFGLGWDEAVAIDHGNTAAIERFNRMRQEEAQS